MQGAPKRIWYCNPIRGYPRIKRHCKSNTRKRGVQNCSELLIILGIRNKGNGLWNIHRVSQIKEMGCENIYWVSQKCKHVTKSIMYTVFTRFSLIQCVFHRYFVPNHCNFHTSTLTRTFPRAFPSCGYLFDADLGDSPKTSTTLDRKLVLRNEICRNFTRKRKY